MRIHILLIGKDGEGDDGLEMLDSTLLYNKEERMYLVSPGYEIIDPMREVEGGRGYHHLGRFVI
jgi:hypothetical protein